MALLGLDYGTTHTVAVLGDRGRYAVLPHSVPTAVGPVLREVFSSLIAFDTQSNQFLYGPDAERLLVQPGTPGRYLLLRSLKRSLRHYHDGQTLTCPGAADRPVSVRHLLTGFAEALCQSIRQSGLVIDSEPLETVLTWPANANGAQRHITRRAFQDAGFIVRQTLSEPAAAAIEYADRIAHGFRQAARRVATQVAVFDLGGGTFDTALIRIAGGHYHVLTTAGIESLGGDDFDAVLVKIIAARLNIDPASLPAWQSMLLTLQACRLKESLSAGVFRRMIFDPTDIGLTASPIPLDVAEYAAALRPLIQPAIAKLRGLFDDPAVQADGITPDTLGAIYLVGGSSRLPLVADMIREAFPKIAIVASDKPFSSTAMGAAIQSAEGLILRERLARHFGVIRLAEGGRREVFDLIFPAGMTLPPAGAPPHEVVAEYTPRHNIGHLRYLECADLDASGRPAQGLRPWSELFFPYDPAVPLDLPCQAQSIVPRDDLACDRIRETYQCDSDGIITVRIRRLKDKQSLTAEIFRNS
jgi:molecular chaperone DnaK (HSP70)